MRGDEFLLWASAALFIAAPFLLLGRSESCGT